MFLLDWARPDRPKYASPGRSASVALGQRMEPAIALKGRDNASHTCYLIAMAQSLSKVYIHMIFSTKNREPAIGSECRSKLWAYLAGGLEALGCHPLKVGGVAEHMHALVELGRTITIGQLIGGIKVESSKWMKRDQGVANFSWQGGYGAFSVSASQREEVAQYIGNQAAHHAKQSFQDEFRAFLKRYDVDYDERYLWD